MYEQVEKPKENKSRSVAKSVAQKKHNGKQRFGFMDNRPKTGLQKNSSDRATATAQLNGGIVQRKLGFDKSAEYLSPSKLDKSMKPAVFDVICHKVSELDAKVLVTGAEPASGSASYNYAEEHEQGIIKVGSVDKYSPDIAKGVKGKKVIALAHEMQHALDDLKPGGKLKGKVRGSSSDWYPKIISELRAHLTQAIATKQMQKAGSSVSQTDALLAGGYNEKGFEVGGFMYNKLLAYFEAYKADMETGLSREAKSDNKVWREAQVNEFIFLNWGEIKEYIDILAAIDKK
ncbi:hypothetical protein [Shewanella sp. YLB-07]|uniref:hypothetical protein n=1 Tax=Shewanella sp. YLB-07 TaxID=2601268 RepID=UPI00128AFE2B|nr:hypothetical protein [Shewanella sp. YLB-07]MPY23404.1 hypothetical protein [Shewanella sp. YLB-07]